ncbi:MAG: hypothetical protein C5B50_08265 [Verrucomicrobia bacterium]|nr:MAG: hypothetical protein C5B50_08265 [Verrucomicrobiota bacterium]
MKKLWCIWLLALSVLSVRAAPPAGYYLVWGDEFNATALDTNKWDYWLLGNWRNAVNTKSAVTLNGSNLVITTYTSNNVNYTAMLATEHHFRPRYGYFESSIKWGDTNGMWSAFWLRSPTMGTWLDDSFVSGAELDVCEHRYVGIYATNIANIISCNIHWNGYGSAEQGSGSPNVGTGLATGFHSYGLLWALNDYSFSVDGSEVWNGASTTPNFGSDVYVLLSSEVDDTSTQWAGYIPPGGYGSQATSSVKMIVDYFRYYAPTNVIFWVGTNSVFWTNSANWMQGMSPVSASDLTFSYLSASMSNVLGRDYSVDGLIFVGMTNACSINGANTLTLGPGGIDMVAADQNVTLNVPITIGADQRWTAGRNSPGNLLTVNSPLAGTATLTKAGYGTMLLKGSNSFAGTLNVGTGGSATNDGLVLITQPAAVAHVAAISIRNGGFGISTLQFSNNVSIPQGISLAGRTTNNVGLESLSGSNTLSGTLTLASGGPNFVVKCDAGTLTLAGTVSAGNGASGPCLLTLAGGGNFIVSGPIQNGSATPLSLLKTNAGTLTFSGTTSYTGTTTNWGGQLIIVGSLGGPLIFNAGTLAGTGTVTGDTTMAGGEISPGPAIVNSIGTLSFGGNLSLTSHAVTLIELNAAAQSNDQLIVAGTLNCSGTLYVNNLAGTFAAGQSFQIFRAGAYAGTFSTITLPSLDPSLAWDTSHLTLNGVISVAALPSVTVSPPATNVECSSALTLVAQASGTPPLNYQWFDNQTNAIPGATNTTLTLSQATVSQSGNYTVQVANNFGSASALATVTISDTTPPVITWSFTNLVLTADSTGHAPMPDVTGTNSIRAYDTCSTNLAFNQTPLSSTALARGANPVLITVADDSGNTVYSSNTVFVTTHLVSIVPIGSDQLQLSWDYGTLQSATNSAGPYLDVPNATSPYTNSFSGDQQFYRVRE